MAPTANRLLGTLLTASLFASGYAVSGSTSTSTTCVEEEVNLFQNPSFETGDLSGWNSYIVGSVEEVVSGDASDGNEYL